MNRHSRGATSDPLLVVEAALVLLLALFFVFLYVIPTEQRLSDVHWWSPLVLGSLALAVLLTDVTRRKRRYRRRMRSRLDEAVERER